MKDEYMKDMFMIVICRFLHRFFTYKVYNRRLSLLFEEWKYGWIDYQYGK